MPKPITYCYICGEISTSKEHAPPKSFFPKSEKIGDLTTVPSCAIHNEDTSKDDEYVRNVIAMLIGNNETAVSHFLETCIKSFKRSPKLLSATTKVRKQVFYREGNKIKPTDSYQIDRDRIDLVLRKIAYATFYKKYEERWNRELAVGTENLRESNMMPDDYGLLIMEAKKELDEPTYEGTNPNVFKFSFLPGETDDINDQILILKFYDGFEAWIFAQPNTTGPKW